MWSHIFNKQTGVIALHQGRYLGRLHIVAAGLGGIADQFRRVGEVAGDVAPGGHLHEAGAKSEGRHQGILCALTSEQLVELAARVKGVQVVATADVVVTDPYLRHGRPAASFDTQCFPDVGAAGANLGERDALGRQQVLRRMAVRAKAGRVDRHRWHAAIPSGKSFHAQDSASRRETKEHGPPDRASV
jgi:hypothetical protein